MPDRSPWYQATRNDHDQAHPHDPTTCRTCAPLDSPAGQRGTAAARATTNPESTNP